MIEQLPALTADTDHADLVRRGVTRRTVLVRRLAGLVFVLGPLIWAAQRAGGAGDLVNTGGLSLVDDLLSYAWRPSLDGDFLRIVLDAARVTVVFAVLGTLGALAFGFVGGWILSDVAWGHAPRLPIRLLRLGLRGLLVAVRSIHEVIWALLFVSVLGLDPLVAVLAIAVPFGAQTAKVFAEILDGVPVGPQAVLRQSGASRVTAFGYALLPAAAPLLVSYSFYRFECALRAAVLLGVAGVGGLGQELVVSLQSRNWDEVWTLILTVVLLSAVVDAWSTRVRRDLDVTRCAEDDAGRRSAQPRRPGASRWTRGSALVLVPIAALTWWASDVSLSGLTSARTRMLTGRLWGDLWPPALPSGGWSVVTDGVLDTLAMAVLAMAIALVVTLLIGPWATRPRGAHATRGVRAVPRYAAWVLARTLLLVLRSVPPTVWAVVALLAFFPGILPGAVALGLYTGGILGRLVAEGWESVDLRSRDLLGHSGVRRSVASLTAVAPASAYQLVSYGLYRFEICVRDTAVVGVVGASGLGRLLSANFAAFRFPVVSTLLAASFAVTVLAEVASRRLRRTLTA